MFEASSQLIQLVPAVEGIDTLRRLLVSRTNRWSKLTKYYAVKNLLPHPPPPLRIDSNSSARLNGEWFLFARGIRDWKGERASASRIPRTGASRITVETGRFQGDVEVPQAEPFANGAAPES